MVSKIRYLTVALGLLWYQPVCVSQVIQVDGSRVNDKQGGYFARWDSMQEKLLLYRSTSASAVPAARIYGKDGTGVVVFPLRDVAESQYIDVWGVAATPDGGIVLAAVVGYTPRGVKPTQLKSALLTYDGSGSLRSFWEVQPYQYDLVAVDAAGNVFGLGMSNLDNPYPLIVKYSPEGKILKEFFPSSMLALGDKGLLTHSPGGENQLLISGNQLLVWVAASNELFRFSLNGDLIGRIQVSQALNAFAAAAASKGFEVMEIASNSAGDLTAQVLLSGRPPSNTRRIALVRLAADGSQATLLSTIEGQSKFMGKSKTGKDIFLQYDPTNKMSSVVER
jgi:hypothetical protein